MKNSKTRNVAMCWAGCCLIALAAPAPAQGDRGPGGRRQGSGGGRQDVERAMLARVLGASDTDRDGKVTPEEWTAWLASLGANQDGVVPAGKIEMPGGRAPGPAQGRRGAGGPSLDRDRDGKIELTDLEKAHGVVDSNGDGTLDAEELGGGKAQSGAPVGKKAPDFDLASAKDPERRVRLSSFAGERPVALVFGSYT